MQSITSPWCRLTLAAAGLLFFGCGEDAQKTADTLKKTVTRAANVVTETVARPRESVFELKTGDQPTVIKGGQAQVAVIPGRPLVLQVTSYTDPAREGFPSFFLRISTPGNNVAELVGKTLPGELFYQRQKFESPLISPPGKSVPVTITSANDTFVMASFEPAPLIDAQGKEAIKLGGTLTALVRAAPHGGAK